MRYPLAFIGVVDVLSMGGAERPAQVVLRGPVRNSKGQRVDGAELALYPQGSVSVRLGHAAFIPNRTAHVPRIEAMPGMREDWSR